MSFERYIHILTPAPSCPTKYNAIDLIIAFILSNSSPLEAAAQHVMAYPSAYPLAHPGLMPEPLLANHPSHSIHVGAPNVNVDVHTTREHVAQNPEKQVKDI